MPSMGLTWIDIGVLALVVVTGGVVALFAFLVWRNGYVRGWQAARDVPPTCPACGYDLSGLTQCRCPECGATYEIDKLWRTSIQRRRSKNDVARTPAVRPATQRQ